MVRTVDLPGVFMQAGMLDLVHVHFAGEMVNKLLEIDEEMYDPCMAYEKVEHVLYVELLKALYGTTSMVILGIIGTSGVRLGIHPKSL